MNNVVGIVAELNPIHYGHCYLMEEARKRASAEAVVCVMSGNFVQRGAPALYDKWERTAMALECGADLIIEIPTVFCLGNASVYARAGVQLLESMGVVTHLACGSETGDVNMLSRIANLLNTRHGEIEQQIRARISDGFSYPAARQRVIEEMLSVNLDEYTSPNDILALEYLRNIRTLQPLAIPRVGAAYHDANSFHEKLYSSTAVRAALYRNQLRPHSVPWNPMKHPLPQWTIDRSKAASGEEDTSGTSSVAETLDAIEARWFDLIRYRILSVSPAELDEAPGGGEGLGYRLQMAARSANSIDELILAVKSKRYTYTRISRWLYQILLGIRREDQLIAPEYLRVLGFNDRGREILRTSKHEEKNSLPYIENVNRWQGFSKQLDMDIHASDVYNLVGGNDIRESSDYCRKLMIHSSIKC